MARRTRSDSLRNAERLRLAAAAVFSADGASAPLDKIARVAEVSIGTLYNHFPRREDLIEAVLPDVAREQRDRILAAAERGITARERWARYIREVLAVQSSDRLLSEALAPDSPLPPSAREACDEVIRRGEEILREARDSGTHLLLTESGFRALVAANGIIHASAVPPGWNDLFETVALAEGSPAAQPSRDG